MNRNHYMMLGTVFLLLGLTVFKLEAITFTAESTRIVAQRMGTVPEEGPIAAAVPKKTVPLPPWLRFSFISLGAVLMLHAIGMQKP